MTPPMNSNSAHRAADYGAPYSDVNPPSVVRRSAPAHVDGAIPYADIQKIRSGMPVERTWDLYPRLSAFMSGHIDAITGDPCALIGDPTFTKLIVAAFGNGKTTLCDQLTSQWVNAGLVASLISIELVWGAFSFQS